MGTGGTTAALSALPLGGAGGQPGMGSLVLSSASLARFSKAHLFTDWQGPPPATPTRTPHLVVHDRGGGVRDCGGDSSTGDRLRAVMPPGEAAGIDAQVLLL
jgi:hypothetical protein